VPDDDRVLYALVVRVKPGHLDKFDAYERQVLPLLARYGGVLEERARSLNEDDGATEIHLVSFPSNEAFEQYRDEPERGRYWSLFEDSVESATLVPVRRMGVG
jgi:antibiotic biosynthesis monooxygenase (ABM) superfamily enzyme